VRLLAGAQIPVEAVIVGLADAWDAMTTDRPYHRALSPQEAFAEVRVGRGGQFAPALSMDSSPRSPDGRLSSDSRSPRARRSPLGNRQPRR
jgi:hypothetical protein